MQCNIIQCWNHPLMSLEFLVCHQKDHLHSTRTNSYCLCLCVLQVLQRHHPADVRGAGWQAGDLVGQPHHPHQLPVYAAGGLAGGESGAQEAHSEQHHRCVSQNAHFRQPTSACVCVTCVPPPTGTCLSLSLLAIGFLISAQHSPPVTYHPLDPAIANSTCSKYQWVHTQTHNHTHTGSSQWALTAAEIRPALCCKTLSIISL